MSSLQPLELPLLGAGSKVGFVEGEHAGTYLRDLQLHFPLFPSPPQYVRYIPRRVSSFEREWGLPLKSSRCSVFARRMDRLKGDSVP